MARDEFFQVFARFRDVFPQTFRSQFETWVARRIGIDKFSAAVVGHLGAFIRYLKPCRISRRCSGHWGIRPPRVPIIRLWEYLINASYQAICQ